MCNTQVAIEHNDLAKLKTLPEHDPSLVTLTINAQPGYGTLMHVAAACGNVPIKFVEKKRTARWNAIALPYEY